MPTVQKINSQTNSNQAATITKPHFTQAEKDTIFRQAVEIAKTLSERNVFSISKLIRTFGLEIVEQKAIEAKELFAQAQAQGESAHSASEQGTALVTAEGQPRTEGGVFFYLIQQYAEIQGWDNKKWHALMDANGPKSKKKKKAGSGTIPGAIQEIELSDTPPVVTGDGTNGEPSPAAIVAALKPTRTKVTIIGSMSASPKLIKRQDGSQLVELTFIATMGQSLPKGLPNLGQSLVKVWATPKQWQRVEPEYKSQPKIRLIVEGEMKASVSRDLLPFTKVITTRLTTVEAERARQIVHKASQQTDNSAGDTASANNVVANSGSGTANNSNNTANERPKPTAVKLVVSGVLVDNPQLVTQENGTQLVELEFKSEMNAAVFPKGLPNLGGSQVIAICTQKQWKKVEASAYRFTRFLVEGEGVAQADEESLEPFVKVVCLNLKTLS